LDLTIAESDPLFLNYCQKNSQSVLNKYAYYPQFTDLLSDAVTLHAQQQRQNTLVENSMALDQSDNDYHLFTKMSL